MRYGERVVPSSHLSDVWKCYFSCMLKIKDICDNILLLSASVGSLQKMLDVCYRKGETIDIIFNARKSSLFVAVKVIEKIVHWSRGSCME